MSKYLGMAGQKLFAQHMEKYAPADPLYEHYTDPQGVQKRRKVCLPFSSEPLIYYILNPHSRSVKCHPDSVNVTLPF